MTDRQNELHIVVGDTRTGKTTTAKAIYAHLLATRRAAIERDVSVIFDPASGRPEDEWRPKGAVYVRSRLEFLRELEPRLEAEAAPPLVVKASFRDWSPLELIGRLLLVVDEAHRYMSGRRLDDSASALFLLHGHRRVDGVVSTQGPCQFHPDVVRAAAALWLHPVTHRSDIRWIEETCRVSYDELRWRPIPGTLAYHPIRWTRDEGFTGMAEDAGGERCPTCGRPRA